MAIPKYRIGLACMLCAVLLVRIVVYYSYAAAGMTPDQIWYSMSAPQKGFVFLGFVLFVFGLRMIVKSVFHRPAAKGVSHS